MDGGEWGDRDKRKLKSSAPDKDSQRAKTLTKSGAVRASERGCVGAAGDGGCAARPCRGMPRLGVQDALPAGDLRTEQQWLWQRCQN